MDWIALDLFNDDTCPSGHISRPTQVNVSQELLSFSKKPSYTGKCVSELLSFSKQLLKSDHIVQIASYQIEESRFSQEFHYASLRNCLEESIQRVDCVVFITTFL